MLMARRKKKDDKGLLFLLVGGVALLLLNKKTSGGGGTGTPSVPGGKVSAVGVAQLGAMRSHKVQKRAYDNVTITIGWTASTKNAAGQPIPWRYAFDYDLTDSGGVVRQGGGLLVNGEFLFAQPNGPATSTSVLALTGLGTGPYGLKCSLWAARSNPDGTPDPDHFVALGDLSHPDAIQVTG